MSKTRRGGRPKKPRAPVVAKHRRVEHVDLPTSGGLRLDVRDSGPRDGAVVVLLHGFPQDSRCWLRVEPALHEAGLRTMAPDQRGYSPRAAPPDIASYRVEELALDVLRLLDAAGLERAHLAGHDWGGAVAWHLAAHHPDRVESLTVVSTPHPRAFAWSLTRSTQALRSWYTAAVQLPVLPELVLAGGLAPALRLSGLPRHLAESYAARLGDPGAIRGPLNWYRAAARPLALGVLPPHPPEVVTVPTTYLWGRQDPSLGPAAAHRTREYVADDYRFVEVDSGHWLPELTPSTVAAEIVRRVESTAASRQRVT